MLLLAGCVRDPAEGVAVGNPTKGVTARVVPADDIVELDGSVTVAAFTFSGCDGDELVVAEDFELSVVGETWVPIPAGTWCGLALDLAGPVHLEGRTASGGTFDLDLALERIEVGSGAPFRREHNLVLVIGPVGWLSGEALGLGAGGHVAVRPGDALHDELVARIDEGSSLVEDADGDGLPAPGDDVVADPPAGDAGNDGASPATSDGGSGKDGGATGQGGGNDGKGKARGRDGNPPELPENASENAGGNGKPWRDQDTDDE